MMSRRFSDAQNYYQRMKELQEKLKQSEDERMKLEKKFNKILQTCRAEERIRKLSSAKDNYFQLLEEDRLRSDRNDSLMQILDRIENRACSINAKTERLRLLRKHYEAYMERTYPGWKANESKFYESYNEKLKAINSHFRTLSNDYTDFPKWKTSPEIDVSRDDLSITPAYSNVNFPQTSYSNASSFNLNDQNGGRSNMNDSDSQTDIYNNYANNQLPRQTSIQSPITSTYNKDVSLLEKSMSFKTPNYTLNNISNPIKSSFTTNYSNPASIVSDFNSENFQINNDIGYLRTNQNNQSDMDLDKDFNTKLDYYSNDLDKSANNSQLNSYSPRFSRYDSIRQPLKYSYNPIISPVVKYSNNYSRSSSYTPKSLIRSASLDTFTTKYSPRYRSQNSTAPRSSLYTGENLFRSNSLGRLPQETSLSFSSTKPAESYDYGGGYYKKYSPRTKFPERKSYSTLSPYYTSNRVSSDAGYFSHRSTSPANSSYSLYNTGNSSYSRYNTPRLTRSNSIQKNYEPSFTSTAPRRSGTSNLPYMSTLSRSQSFSEIDDLDYLSRKKNYDMSGWSQYPMGRERFCYDNRNTANYPASPYGDQYRSCYSPDPSPIAKIYSFQADKSTSTDDGYDKDKTIYGKRMNRVHYADNMDDSTSNYNDFNSARPLDSNSRAYDRDLYPHRPIDEFERSAAVSSEMTGPLQKKTESHVSRLSNKEEPDRTLSNEKVIQSGSSLDEFKSPSTLPYSQQILQTLEERTEEDITQSTSENPSLSSEQHWENEIGKLKDIMSYDSQTDTFVPSDKKDLTSSTEPHSYKKSSKNLLATDSFVKPMDAEKLNSTEKNLGNSQLPDLKQEIEMLRNKKPAAADENDDCKQEREQIHSNSMNDYLNPDVRLDEQSSKQAPPYYQSSEYNTYSPGENIGDTPREQKVHLSPNSQRIENLNGNTNTRITQRGSPSHDLEESQVLEKQDQPEKFGSKFSEVRGSNKELNKSSINSPPRQISPVSQVADRNENDQRQQKERQMPKENLLVPESKSNNLRDMGNEQSFPRSTTDKSPPRSQFNIDHLNMNKNQPIGDTNSVISEQSNGINPGIALNLQEQADKVYKSPPLDKLNPVADPSIGMNETSSRVNDQNQTSGQQIQPNAKTNTSRSGDSLLLEKSQSPKANNQNTFQQQNAGVEYDQTQKNEDIQKENLKHQSPQNIPQNYQPQQQLYKNEPQMQPISSDEDKEHNQIPPTQMPQQLGDAESLQQPVIQNQQQYEQPQYQNYEGREPYDQYSYNVAGGDKYQPQYDNTNAYQYNEEQMAQQYSDNQQYQEPQYSQPQIQDRQYPPLNEDQYPPQQEGQYNPQQEGQYPQEQDGQYPQQQEDQYQQQQGDQYPQQQGDQYPQPHEVQYSQQQMGNYPPQQDQQYPAQYSEDNMTTNQMPNQRQYPEGHIPDNPNEQQYIEEPQAYSGDQLPQQYMQGENQQPYQDGQYAQQYGDGHMAQNYSNEQYNNFQQDNTAYPENYYDQQQYPGYNEPTPDQYQQNPDQFNATKPGDQLYSEGQLDDKDNQPTEQALPSADNYDEHKVEPQLPDNGSPAALQGQQDMESTKLNDENQKEMMKVEPDKAPSPGTNTAESDKKSEGKSINSPKHDGSISTAAEPASSGDRPATATPKPSAASKVNEKNAEGKPDGKQAPTTPARGEKTAEGSGKGTSRAVEKKGDAGGKTSAAKMADSKPGVKTKAGDKSGGVKGAATVRTATKAQK